MVRRAELQRRWHAVVRESRPSLPRSVTLSDELDLLPSDVELRAPVTIFAGLNGVGKTRLFRLLNESLSPHSRLISLHDLCGWVTRVVKERPDLADVTEEASPLELDTETLDAVKAIVRRDYDEVLWFAPDFSDSPFEEIVGDTVSPYFVVAEGDARYTMQEMGLGELAAHVLLWVLWYLREAEDLVLLLDEPDAFFPPSSRESLIDYLGSMALVRGFTFVITTHSRELIDRGLSQDGVLSYIERSSAGVRFLTDRTTVKEIVRTSLYPERELQVVCWVEDEASRAFAYVLLTAIDRSLPGSMKLYWLRGEGNLRAMRERFIRPPARPGDLEFMFLSDGDQAPMASDPGLWPNISLPGGEDPDGLIKEHAGTSRDRLAELLNLPPDVLGSLLDSNAGQDPHDFTEALLDASPHGREQGLRALSLATIEARPDLVEAFRDTLKASGIAAFRSLD